MTVIHTDRRRIEYQEAPEECRRLEEGRAAWLEATLRRAIDLGVVMERRAWCAQDCASFDEYLRLMGYPVLESLDLAWLGRALLKEPGLADELRANRIPFENACAVARLIVEDLLREGEDALALARSTPLRDVRRLVRRRVEEERTGVPDGRRRLEDVTVHVPAQTKDDFERARRIASGRANRRLSESEAFKVVVDHYLDDHDPTRTQPRARRVGPTHERPEDRYVPGQVVRDPAKLGRVSARAGSARSEAATGPPRRPAT